MIHETTAIHLRVLPAPDHAHTLHAERLYVGIDISKAAKVAGFVSVSLLKLYGRLANCPKQHDRQHGTTDQGRQSSAQPGDLF